MKLIITALTLLCAGCIVRYDHTFLRSKEWTVTKLGRGELAVTAVGEGSGSKTRPPWALRITGEWRESRGSFILVKGIRATVNGQTFTHPDVLLDFSTRSWAQTMTGHFIPKPEDTDAEVILSYRIVTSDSSRKEQVVKFRFHTEKSSGTVVANPFLDFT